MKRYLVYIIFLLLIVITLFSCIREIDIEHGSSGNGKIEVSLLLNLSQRQQLKSRSTGDDFIDPEKIYLLVFNVDESGIPTTLRELAKASSGNVSTNNGVVNFTAALSPSTNKSGIYVVVNVDVTSNAGDTFEDIENSLKTPELAISEGEIASMPSSHPMVSDLFPAATITQSFTMGTAANPVKLFRNTVKVNASTTELDNQRFELISISLYNAPVAGYVFPDVELAQALNRFNYAANLKQTWDNNTKQTGDILCYEAPVQKDAASKKSPFVIIKGQYDGHEGYYKVEFIQRNANGNPVEIALLRNCIFTFNIKNVQRGGYATIEEAILNTASNAIIYDVLIEDMFSTDIVSNGEQYLGVSNSELVVHSDHDVKAENVLAVTISYTTNPSWTTPGKITCSAGIIPVSGTEIPVSKNVINRVDLDIYISLEEDFTTGTIMLSVGDLRKEVTVRRSILPAGTPLTYDGGYVELTNQSSTQDKPILLAEVLNPHLTTWIRLSTTTGRGAARSKIVLQHNSSGQPLQQLFVHVWGNEEAIYTLDSKPLGYFYISYANDHGRTRYCVAKEVTEISFNANGGHGQPGDMYEWTKQSDDNDNAYIVLPQVEPVFEGYNFLGWTKNSDGSGVVFQPNTLYNTVFSAKDKLYAKWVPKPVLKPYIYVGGAYWAVGNLVADGENAAKIGTSTARGLMFKFGSLIGFDRSSLAVALKPTDCSIASPNIEDKGGNGYTGTGNIPADNFQAGVGDPCRYYLNGTWRLPTKSEYDALNLSSSNFTNSSLQVEGENEEGGRSYLVLPEAKLYGAIGFASSWMFSGNTMYRTTNIFTPFGFNNSGNIVTGGDGWTDSYSLGAIRCVNSNNPNTTP